MSTLPSLCAGLVVQRPTPAATLAAIVRAEGQGVDAIWSTVVGTAPDPITLFAAAAARTTRINFGVAIVPTYPRHPVALASQALVLASLAPGRLRLGIGPSLRLAMERMFGLPMGKPLDHLREYLAVLRGLLWEGRADFDGEYFHVHAALPSGTAPPRIPIPISALRVNAFHLTGEIADGAISWLCPVPYLLGTALPALRAGAAAAGRPPPPLIGHVPVAMHTDREAVREKARTQFARYGQLPFYAHMFADAGFPVSENGALSDALLDALVVSGDAETVAARLHEIQAAGVDELLVLPVPIVDVEAETDALAALIARR